MAPAALTRPPLNLLRRLVAEQHPLPEGTASSQPICGAIKIGPDGGEDCPLCGLVFEDVEADERPCPFCGQSHWEDQP